MILATIIFLIAGGGFFVGQIFRINLNANADTISATAVPISKGGTSANTAPNAVYNLNMWPIGSIYTSISPTNPSEYFGGTWESYGTGRTLVGINTGNTLMDTVNETFGSANAIVPYHNHTFTGNQLPVHHHGELQTFVQSSDTYTTGVKLAGSSVGSYNGSNVSAGTPTGTISFAGVSGNATNANYQPSIAVYFWQRTQ